VKWCLVEIIDGVWVGPCLKQTSHVRVVQRHVVEGGSTLQVGSIYVTSSCNQQLHDGYLLVFGSDDEGRSSESILRVKRACNFRHKLAHAHAYTLLVALVTSGTEIQTIKHIKQNVLDVFGFMTFTMT